MNAGDLIIFPDESVADVPPTVYKVLATRARYADLEVVSSADPRRPIGHRTSNSEIIRARITFSTCRE